MTSDKIILLNNELRKAKLKQQRKLTRNIRVIEDGLLSQRKEKNGINDLGALNKMERARLLVYFKQQVIPLREIRTSNNQHMVQSLCETHLP